MKVIRVRNVHHALPLALDDVFHNGVRRESRNGDVLKFREPVTTVYSRPTERVVFWAARDANPFFHLFESLWMLSGRNDVASVEAYVKRMASFSDDGRTLHGAYGYRWRYHFGFDQMLKIIAALRTNPDDRRQVLSMWDARADLGRNGKDLPCNLQAIFQVADDGRLDMLVTNRSNDIIWGAYGANAVHFSYLHEYVASWALLPVGIYRQVSTNLHMYLNLEKQAREILEEAGDPSPILGFDHRDPYATREVEPFPLVHVEKIETWQYDLNRFMAGLHNDTFAEPFFRRVAVPMARAHHTFKTLTGPERFEATMDDLEQVHASDWKLAAQEWVQRRFTAYLERVDRAQDDGVSYE